MKYVIFQLDSVTYICHRMVRESVHVPEEGPLVDKTLNTPDPFKLFPEILTEPLIVRVYNVLPNLISKS